MNLESLIQLHLEKGEEIIIENGIVILPESIKQAVNELEEPLDIKEKIESAIANLKDKVYILEGDVYLSDNESLEVYVYSKKKPVYIFSRKNSAKAFKAIDDGSEEILEIFKFSIENSFGVRLNNSEWSEGH